MRDLEDVVADLSSTGDEARRTTGRGMTARRKRARRTATRKTERDDWEKNG